MYIYMHVTTINGKRDHKFGNGKGVCETVWERGGERRNYVTTLVSKSKKIILNEKFPNIV